VGTSTVLEETAHNEALNMAGPKGFETQTSLNAAIFILIETNLVEFKLHL
jgi:hypothetical protein